MGLLKEPRERTSGLAQGKRGSPFFDRIVRWRQAPPHYKLPKKEIKKAFRWFARQAKDVYETSP